MVTKVVSGEKNILPLERNIFSPRVGHIQIAGSCWSECCTLTIKCLNYFLLMSAQNSCFIKRHFLNSIASGFMKIPFLEMSLFYFELMGEVDSEIQTGTACQHWEGEVFDQRGNLEKDLPEYQQKLMYFAPTAHFPSILRNLIENSLGRLRLMEKYQKNSRPTAAERLFLNLRILETNIIWVISISSLSLGVSQCLKSISVVVITGGVFCVIVLFYSFCKPVMYYNTLAC